jgi:type IV secretory pathway VirD2 relaxase
MGKQTRSSGGAHASLRNALLSCIRGAGRSAVRRAQARSRIAVGQPGPDARRVVIKAHVARLTATGAKAASLHLRYIQRDGVERDGSLGVLYDASGPARPRAFEQPRVGEKHQFRLIVSPEDAGELDLTDYVRRLMTRVERDLGRRLEWAAVNHHDTDHPHAHVIIRGVDRDGSEVRIDRGYISNGLRWRAQEIATEELGPRRELDIRRAHAKEVAQERFTSLDRELERRAQDSRVQVRSRQRPGRIDESTMIARLEHLEQLQLSERLSSNEWALTQGWQERLRELGSRGDIIKQIHNAISGNPARYHVVRPGQALPTEPTDVRPVITGRVASKGLSDELKGTFYAVIETPTGSAYHVPLDARSAEALRAGDIVSLATKPEAPVRPLDRHIADVARRHHGVYELAPDSTSDAERSGRRMRDLERLGLARPTGANRWTVAPNLLEELERRHRDALARHRLLIYKQPLSLQAQVPHPGPVWLDRIDPASLALYGLGAEVQRAIEHRRAALRHIGIAYDDPNRFAKLREVERRSLGKDLAASSRQAFVANTPDGFRGRVLEAHASPTGTSYTAVSDGQRFVLLKTNPSLRGLQSKSVTISRDGKGRLVAREAPDRGIER